METLIIIALIVGIIYTTRKTKTTKERFTPRTETSKQLTETPQQHYDQEIEDGLTEINNMVESINYIKQAYEPKWMFTMNEKPAYYKLQKIAKERDMIVFAKVRLFDLVEPIKKHPKYKTNLYKIQAKHVDFVIAKNNLVAKYIIELDDSSHNTKERKERDNFVDMVLTSCGYKVLRTREINEEEVTNFLKN